MMPVSMQLCLLAEISPYITQPTPLPDSVWAGTWRVQMQLQVQAAIWTTLVLNMFLLLTLDVEHLLHIVM
jgi:hypothetical protein